MARLDRLAAFAVVAVAIAAASPAPCSADPAKSLPVSPPAQSIPEDTAPGRSGSSSGALSDKLERSDGVIHPPPDVDPGMTQTPPRAGRMPVIPPPGTPGGEPGPNPK